MANENIRHRSTTGTRLTPEWVIDLCEEMMGGIDLDPTSEPGPPFNVPAKVHWTKEDDCLRADRVWTGNVFLNPPYGKRRGVERFLYRCRWAHYKGEMVQALVLLPVDSSTEWWKILGQEFSWCAFYDRLKFDEMETGAGYPSAMFYLGPFERRFVRYFREVGQIYRPI